jgi:hypothetical protein
MNRGPAVKPVSAAAGGTLSRPDPDMVSRPELEKGWESAYGFQEESQKKRCPTTPRTPLKAAASC